jgi:hypothetical protein
MHDETTSTDAGVDRLRGECASEICGALRRTIWSLPSADRRLLFNHFVVGMTIDVLSELYGVHRSTIARRIRRVTHQIGESVRANVSPLGALGAPGRDRGTNPEPAALTGTRAGDCASRQTGRTEPLGTRR